MIDMMRLIFIEYLQGYIYLSQNEISYLTLIRENSKLTL